MTRHVLIIELCGDTLADAVERVKATLPDAQLWGDVDPVAAALLVIDDAIAPLAA